MSTSDVLLSVLYNFSSIEAYKKYMASSEHGNCGLKLVFFYMLDIIMADSSSLTQLHPNENY